MRLRAISLGAGVQSTALALMAKHGEVTPTPDCAIFADTGWEPRAVYEHLDWLSKALPFPVYRVQRSNLRDDLIAGGFSSVPFYMPLADTPGVSMGARQCTYQYKLRPIYRAVREMLGGTPRGGCELWIGISLDELARIKPARVKYITNRWPLVEKRLSRGDCLQWMARNGYPTPPRSACLGCPFKSASEWRDLKRGPADEWTETVAMDAVIRRDGKRQYMHRSLMPLDEIDFTNAEDRGQTNMFNNECEGMCGV